MEAADASVTEIDPGISISLRVKPHRTIDALLVLSNHAMSRPSGRYLDYDCCRSNVYDGLGVASASSRGACAIGEGVLLGSLTVGTAVAATTGDD